MQHDEKCPPTKMCHSTSTVGLEKELSLDEKPQIMQLDNIT